MVDLEKIEQFKKLNRIELEFLLMELLKIGKLDFITLTNHYVHCLEEEKKKQFNLNATLGLYLSFYAKDDKSPEGKTARRLIYDTGAFGHNDGSLFGELLDKEFGPATEPD